MVLQRSKLAQVLKLSIYTKSMLYITSHMLDSRNVVEGIKSYAELRTFLNISTVEWNEHIREDINKLNLLSAKKINGKWYMFFNPTYTKHLSFFLTKEVLDIFKDDILNDISSFIDNIDDWDVFKSVEEYLCDSEKEYLIRKLLN